jgi:O-acetyl-ADP-ribose deacetylase (regulator of RNase III)
MQKKLEIIQGDITKATVDAIVNAANEWMLGGGGVDGAIHRAAGAKLLEACKAFPEVRTKVRCPTGDVRITPAFELAAKFVIHTVGPIWRGGHDDEDRLLESCYRRSMQLAVWVGCRSIAFPAISCGAYGFPIRRAADISVRTIQTMLNNGAPLDRVVLIAFERETFQAWQDALSHEHNALT